jgi:pimeloyl-ACP methyl ester carboxylesterase
MKHRIGQPELAWEEAGRGAPVVFLHAFPLNRKMWAPQVAALAAGYRVITPDFRGHGESGVAEEDSTMERLAEDARGLLDHLKLERVVLGGLSMGGYVAFAFLRRWPERVRALILADTRASADTEEARKGRYATADLTEREGSVAIAEMMVPKLLAPGTLERKPEVVAAVRQMILEASPAGIAHALRGMAARPASFDLLPQIKCPTLIVVGEEDGLTPPADSEAMATAVPKSTLVKIPDAGHLSNLEQEERFNQAILDFLQGLRG